MAILHNRAQCNYCQDILESTHEHDFRTCSCGNLSVDGGYTHLSRTCRDRADYVELSEMTSASEKCEKPETNQEEDSHHSSDTNHRDEAMIQSILDDYPELPEAFIREAYAKRTMPITSHQDMFQILEELRNQIPLQDKKTSVNKTAMTHDCWRIGKHLKAARQAKAQSKIEVGYAIGVSRRTLSQIENGSFNGSIRIVQCYADYLGLQLMVEPICPPQLDELSILFDE